LLQHGLRRQSAGPVDLGYQEMLRNREISQLSRLNPFVRDSCGSVTMGLEDLRLSSD